MDKRVLPTKQKAAIAALVAGANHTEAAAQAGVHLNRIGEWMKDPAFVGELRQAEGKLVDSAARGLLAMQEKALGEMADTFAIADEQTRVNIADFISEEPKALTIGRGEQAKTVYIESGNLNWAEIRKRGHLIKRIAFNQYGPILELYDAQAAAGLKLRAAQSVMDLMLKLRELNTLEERIAALEAAHDNRSK